MCLVDDCHYHGFVDYHISSQDVANIALIGKIIEEQSDKIVVCSKDSH